MPGKHENKRKELIAYHVHDALKAGAFHNEIVEAVGVAILIGDGPVLIYGAEALEVLEQFEVVRAK